MHRAILLTLLAIITVLLMVRNAPPCACQAWPVAWSLHASSRHHADTKCWPG